MSACGAEAFPFGEGVMNAVAVFPAATQFTRVTDSADLPAILVVPVRVELTLEPYESPVRTTRRHHIELG
jgi:hypothetical protein